MREGKWTRERQSERDRGWFERGEREWIMIQPTLAATTLLESIPDERNERERERKVEKKREIQRDVRKRGLPIEEQGRRSGRRGERTAYHMHIEASFHGHRRLKVPT